MKIAVLRERRPHEKRVAASPETVKKLIALGASIAIETGAGQGSRVPDSAFEGAGATIVADAAAAVADADILLTVQRPDAAVLANAKPGVLVIGLLAPYAEKEALAPLSAKAALFAMEFVPRISRAQAMDALSSQANLAGYKAVIDAASEFSRAMPMMMTAAGTVAPARVLVFGAGVAGLQAIATARRLGAIVSATDVRPASKEQVESLGATFVAVIDDEFKQAETAAGYAKPMSPKYQAKQAALIAETIKKQDIAICTALIPGRKAPVLITEEMVATMKPGSIIVDLAVEQGGNCPLSKPGEVVEVNGVTLMGHLNVPSRIAQDSSNLYAKNLLNLVTLLVDKSTKTLNVPWDDEIVKGALVAKDGAIVHPQLQG
ncbi:NAD(P) transhydrogenase subunit alpha part 1 [Alphaproteobacteria bacterium SO-S41]|nr:NAD(P) transhydrogenase subunit alpha part 1 [Alphaproteobacteria bacterium SO-S41]